MQKELIIVGGGSGTEGYIVPEAIRALEKVDCVIASERFLDLVKAKKTRPMEKISVLLDELPYLLEKESIGIIVSGDPLMYSLYRTILKKYPELSIKVIAGISSLQILGATFGLTMEDAAILSIHGRDCSLGKIAYTVSKNPISFFFCSKF
ncbi:MAG: precorrin-6y C5,15-methyltransferase (decarboxylating) subunit CbiE, partial [Ruminococcus sp.]|nr:precorrin-6y C5,15-methyltransferase (decarboxylating) subunit CbiE [Ruminococcus sp.]